MVLAHVHVCLSILEILTRDADQSVSKIPIVSLTRLVLEINAKILALEPADKTLTAKLYLTSQHAPAEQDLPETHSNIAVRSHHVRLIEEACCNLI